MDLEDFVVLSANSNLARCQLNRMYVDFADLNLQVELNLDHMLEVARKIQNISREWMIFLHLMKKNEILEIQ